MTRTSQNLGYFSTGKIPPPLNVRPQQLRTPRMLQEKRGGKKKTQRHAMCNRSGNAPHFCSFACVFMSN